MLKTKKHLLIPLHLNYFPKPNSFQKEHIRICFNYFFRSQIQRNLSLSSLLILKLRIKRLNLFSVFFIQFLKDLFIHVPVYYLSLNSKLIIDLFTGLSDCHMNYTICTLPGVSRCKMIGPVKHT